MSVLHIVPELRAAHMERFADWAPDDAVLYRKRKWDLGGSVVDGNVSRLTVPALVGILRQSNELTVEIPEPLWVRELPMTLSLSLAVRLVKGRKARIVTYCIENNDVSALVGAPKWSKWLAGKVIGATVGVLFGLLLDRVAFGSPGAMTTYSTLPGFLRAEHRLILELPSSSVNLTDRDGIDVLFVGRLEDRKGVRQLLEAWRSAESLTGASITIVGSGPLEREVADWASESPDRRTHIKHVEHAAMGDVYESRRVLVAPSIRDGRWREQIGLPIKEALAHGLTIVTTDETGLADWLRAQGHHIVHEVSDLPNALLRAISLPLAPEDVRSSLPALDGRRAADQWLKRP